MVICACATPWGQGALSVVRVSGAGCREIVERVAGRLPPPRRASLRAVRDPQGVFDEAVVTWFPGPSSYTGEDLVELSCHGNPVIVERLLGALCSAGARPASAGEFTRRALVSGRIDLIRAESILATIEATSHRGLSVARAMDGGLRGATESLRTSLLEVCAELEADLDYPGEFDSFDLGARLSAIHSRAVLLERTFQGAKHALEGARVVLVGPVNAGKSSLFNALLGHKRALVSSNPGTTRDVVDAHLQLTELRILLSDTAGERDTVDPIESEGQLAAAACAAAADLLILVRRGDVAQQPPAPPPGRRHLVVYTHRDIGSVSLPEGALSVSSVSGAGLEELKTEIVRALSRDILAETDEILATDRQRACVRTFIACLEQAIEAHEDAAGAAVIVEQAYGALRALDDLSGRDTREEVLDRLFARFCIGK